MARRVKPEVKHHPYMNLAAANFFLPYAKERGVSKVARGESKSTVTKEGFMQAYARVKGDPKKLVTRMATPNQSWAKRRDNFVARHMAQMTLHGEKLWETSGKHKGWPTRRHLGLIMWAMTPDPTIVGRFIVSHEGSSAQRRVIKPRSNKAARTNGKMIDVPDAWVALVWAEVERLRQMQAKGWSPKELRLRGLLLEDIKAAPVWLPSNKLTRLDLRAVLDQMKRPLVVRVAPGKEARFGRAAKGSFTRAKVYKGAPAPAITLRTEGGVDTVRHELAHFIQYLGEQASGVTTWGASPIPSNERSVAYGETLPREFEAALQNVADRMVRQLDLLYYDWKRQGKNAPDTRKRRQWAGELANQIIHKHFLELDYKVGRKLGLKAAPSAAYKKEATRKLANEAVRRIDEAEATYFRTAAPAPPLLPNRAARTNGMSKYRKAPRVSGKAIKVPRDWVDTVMELVKRPVPPETGVATYYVALSLRDDELPALFREAGGLAYFTLTLRVYAGTTVPGGSAGETSTGWYEPATRTLAMAQGEPLVRAAVAHELSHLLQYYGQQLLAEKGNLAAGGAAAPMYGVRRQADASGEYSAEAPIEFEAYVVTAIEAIREQVEGYYERIATVGPQAPPEMPIHRALTDASVRRAMARRLVDATMASWYDRFPDARIRKHFVKKVSAAAVDILDQAERRFARRKIRLPKRAQSEAVAANPRYTSAKRDDPDLWERVKAKVTRGTKGGKAGQWSARKAQLSVAEYQRLGGGYIGPKSPRNALAKWTREKWGTRSGKASLKTGERYLPKAAREALTTQEYAETTRAKRAGLRRGEQFTAQPERVARKTAKYRK